MNLQAELSSLDTSSDSVISSEATSEAEGDNAPTESDVDAQQEMDDKDIFSSDIGSSTSEAVQEDKFWSFGGDVRLGYSKSYRPDSENDEIILRGRLYGVWNPTENLRLASRTTTRCSIESCLPDSLNADLDDDDARNANISVDEVYLHWFNTERFNLVFGRMQTKFVTRGGVFAKSLDRNNSNNVSVNWTDGIHATINPQFGYGWEAHWITEYNDKEGSSSVRRAPLNFSSDQSRLSHFIALENINPVGYIVQRGIDISYLPDSLTDGSQVNSDRRDYWGAVGRIASRFPIEDSLTIQISSEAGYAPTTPSNATIDIDRNGNSSGMAWNVSASAIDIVPNHSFGLLYGETGGGWLLSPQYSNNEKQIEARWSWRVDKDFIIDARIRHREDLATLNEPSNNDNMLDYFIRATWRFNKRRQMQQSWF